MEVLLRQLLAAAVFAVLGIVVLKLSLWLIVKFAPFSVVKEIEQDQNTALAIIIGSVVIGMSIIIAAAIH
jgi:putative membrane protein